MAHLAENDNAPKREPQIRLTVQQVVDRRKSMRCDWYLEAILGAMKKIGHSFRINSISAFCEKIGLSLRTFQRARRFLINAGKLVETRINRDCIEFFLSSNGDKAIVQSDKAIVQSDKAIVQSDKAIVITPLKPAQGNGSDNPSTLIATNLSTLSLSNNEGTEPERENKTLPVKREEIDKDYWDWLNLQALKMPRAIANIGVWIRKQANKPEWKETYDDHLSQIEERKCSAAFSAAEYKLTEIVEPTPEEKEATREAMAQARRIISTITPSRREKIVRPRQERLTFDVWIADQAEMAIDCDVLNFEAWVQNAKTCQQWQAKFLKATNLLEMGVSP